MRSRQHRRPRTADSGWSSRQRDTAPQSKSSSRQSGDHALGGRRTTLAATRQWYARLYRLLPDIHFDLRDIWVSGGPWNTIVVIEWDEANSERTAFAPPAAAFMHCI